MAAGVVSDDLTVEILGKLPVKSLLRFNCVCKTWYSIISDPQFSNNLHQMRRPSVLICEYNKQFSTITLESLLLKDGALTPLPIPWETEHKTVYLGSCNGLVCVSHTSRGRNDLIIWNPSTRQFRKLPCPLSYPHVIEDNLRIFYWFGYDESIDDYKLVWLNLSHIKHPPEVAELDVFTLKSNTWRRSSSVEHVAVAANIAGQTVGVLSNRAIHWIAKDCFSNEMCILVLDLATEKLGVLKFTHARLSLDSRIGNFEGGCLCISTRGVYGDNRLHLAMDLWIMKEYGVESSWTKLLSIPYKFIDPILLSKEEGKERVVIGTMTGGTPGAACGIGKLIVEEGGKKVKNEETLLCAPRNPFRSNVILHMEESLVSVYPTY